MVYFYIFFLILRLEGTKEVQKEIQIHRIYNKENTNILYKYKLENQNEEESAKIFVRNYEDTNVLF